MSEIVLPALRSDDALGVLAALGVVELCTTELRLEATLAWEGLGGAARLIGAAGSTDELADKLVTVARRWVETDRIVPPPDPSFLPAPLPDEERATRRAAVGSEPLDPMRMLPVEAAARFAEQRERELAGDVLGARWLAGLLNPLAREQNGDRQDLTPLYARTGRQNLHQLYRDYRDRIVRRPELLRRALEAWERVDDDSGANLDGRAIRDGAARPDGKPRNAAVPGATWLALMAVPFFRLVGDGGRPLAVGWQSVGKSGRPRRMVWPVWLPALDPPGIEVLLAHPDVCARSTDDQQEAASNRRMRALGVVAVCAASRRVLPNSDGPLQSTRVVWAPS